MVEKNFEAGVWKSGSPPSKYTKIIKMVVGIKQLPISVKLKNRIADSNCEFRKCKKSKKKIKTNIDELSGSLFYFSFDHFYDLYCTTTKDRNSAKR